MLLVVRISRFMYSVFKYQLWIYAMLKIVKNLI